MSKHLKIATLPIGMKDGEFVIGNLSRDVKMKYSFVTDIKWSNKLRKLSVWINLHNFQAKKQAEKQDK